MYTNYLISDNYLMHYGVKGMKWGVRHDPERSAQRARNKAAKGQLNTARKNFNKDYNSWYRQAYKPASYVNGSKANKEYNRRYDQAIKSAQAVNKAKTNYRNVAGKGRDRLDTAAQIVKGVGVVAAAAAVGYGSVYLATNPAVASSVSKAMKTGLGNIAKNAKRGASYMKNARYNKAVQLASPDAASRAVFKRSTYKAMNSAAKKTGRAYRSATNPYNGPTLKGASSKAKIDVRMATQRVKNSVTGYDGYNRTKTGDAKKVIDQYYNRTRGRQKYVAGWNEDRYGPWLYRARKK